MTVERTKSAYFPANQHLVMDTIERILRAHRLYRQTSVNRDTSTVTTTITPGFPLVSTKMTVQLRPVADQTFVKVTTYSQWYIGRDIFRMYDGYVNRLLYSPYSPLASPY